MNRKTTGIIVFPAILILAGCSAFGSAAEKEAKTQVILTAAVWNVQALFDGKETGNEYGEYLESAGWTAEKYKARITALSQAISQMVWEDSASTVHLPGLIGFVEVENIKVLEDLAAGVLSKHGYFWTAFANNPGSSLGVGVLSRFPIKEIRAHSITSGKETSPRPVLEVMIEPEGKPMVFMICHWKSKLGGDDPTELNRRASAKVVQRRLRELKENNAETPVIVMGDLNENHDEFSRRWTLSALLPDNPEAAAIAAGKGTLEDFLILSGEKPPQNSFFPENVLPLYSPWERELVGGSYYYRDEWETIDHCLLSDRSFYGPGWIYNGCKVLNHPPFTTPDGIPNVYIPRNGMGLSDHLPLLLCFNYSDQ